MKYLLFKCDAKNIKNLKSMDRYNPCLRKYLKRGDNGFVFFGYGYELIKSSDIDALAKYTTEERHLASHFALINGVDEREEVFRYVRGREGYKIENSNSFEDSNTCDVFFDYPNGFSIAQRIGCDYMDKIICDYVLALAYIRLINEQNIAKCDNKIFLINPLYGVDEIENAIWDKLLQATNLESKLNNISQKIYNEKNMRIGKRTFWAAVVAAVISACAAIKDIFG